MPDCYTVALLRPMAEIGLDEPVESGDEEETRLRCTLFWPASERNRGWGCSAVDVRLDVRSELALV